MYRQDGVGQWQQLSAAECQALWQHAGGPFRHPDYRSADCFAPDDLGKLITCPALYVYTPMLQPKGFDANGASVPDFHPAGDAFSDSLAAPFTQLNCVGIRCGHFVPEEQPQLLTDHLLAFLQNKP